ASRPRCFRCSLAPALCQPLSRRAARTAPCAESLTRRVCACPLRSPRAAFAEDGCVPQSGYRQPRASPAGVGHRWAFSIASVLTARLPFLPVAPVGRSSRRRCVGQFFPLPALASRVASLLGAALSCRAARGVL